MLDSKFTLSEIANLLSAKLVGDESTVVTAISAFDSATKTDITFITDKRNLKNISKSKAAAILVTEKDLSNCKTNAIVVGDVRLAYAKLSQLFSKYTTMPGIHKTTVIGDNVKIAKTAEIGPFVVIGDNVTIGNNTQVKSNVAIGDDVNIGSDVIIHSNVVLNSNCKIGNRTILHSGVVIGGDGFGYANDAGRWKKIAQLGSVIIGDDVEIGANSCIDKATLDSTIIGNGVKIDNLVHIAHNVSIGDDTAITGLVGIAGSTTIGKRVMIGGAAAINGHINICDDVVIIGKSSVIKSITKPGVYASGTVLQTRKNWQKSAVCFNRLYDLVKRLQKMEKKIDNL